MRLLFVAYFTVCVALSANCTTGDCARGECLGCCDWRGECLAPAQDACGRDGTSCTACPKGKGCVAGMCLPTTSLAVSWSVGGAPCANDPAMADEEVTVQADGIGFQATARAPCRDGSVSLANVPSSELLTVVARAAGETRTAWPRPATPRVADVSFAGGGGETSKRAFVMVFPERGRGWLDCEHGVASIRWRLGGVERTAACAPLLVGRSTPQPQLLEHAFDLLDAAGAVLASSDPDRVFFGPDLESWAVYVPFRRINPDLEASFQFSTAPGVSDCVGAGVETVSLRIVSGGKELRTTAPCARPADHVTVRHVPFGTSLVEATATSASGQRYAGAARNLACFGPHACVARLRLEPQP